MEALRPPKAKAWPWGLQDWKSHILFCSAQYGVKLHCIQLYHDNVKQLSYRYLYALLSFILNTWFWFKFLCEFSKTLLFSYFVGLFHLIEFTQSKTAAVVTSEWMIGKTKCCYPVHFSDSKVISSVRKHLRPCDQWEVFDVRIVRTKGLCVNNWIVIIGGFICH